MTRPPDRRASLTILRSLRTPMPASLLINGLLQARDELRAMWHGKRRRFQCVADRLDPPAEALAQELFGDSVERDTVFRAREAVTFIRKQHVGHRDFSCLHRRDDLMVFGC